MRFPANGIFGVQYPSEKKKINKYQIMEAFIFSFKLLRRKSVLQQPAAWVAGKWQLPLSS